MSTKQIKEKYVIVDELEDVFHGTFDTIDKAMEHLNVLAEGENTDGFNILIVSGEIEVQIKKTVVLDKKRYFIK